MDNEFRKYATKHLGMNGLALDQYTSITNNYISPSILEERQLNVTQMDVFSRLGEHFRGHVHPDDPACGLDYLPSLKHVKTAAAAQIKHRLPFFEGSYGHGVTAR